MEDHLIENAANRYQGAYKKVLCVCSAGLLRSPTAALVLSQEPFNFNTRSVGCRDYAVFPMLPIHLHWADEIVCMEKEHVSFVEKMLETDKISDKRIVVLNVPDRFPYRDEKLKILIHDYYHKTIE